MQSTVLVLMNKQQPNSTVHKKQPYEAMTNKLALVKKNTQKLSKNCSRECAYDWHRRNLQGVPVPPLFGLRGTVPLTFQDE